MPSLIADVRSLLARGLTWWGRELKDLLPAQLRQLSAPAEPLLAIALTSEGLSVLATRSVRQPLQLTPDTDAEIASRIGALAAAGRPPAITLRLPFSACLARRLAVPAAARADARRIVDLELERSTPVGAGGIYTASYPDPGARSAHSETHILLVAKRAPIDKAISRIAALGGAVTKVDCLSAEGDRVLPIDLLARSRDASGVRQGTESATGNGRLAWGLSAIAAALVASAVGLSILRHEQALAALEVETAKLRDDVLAAGSVRGAKDAARANAAAVHALSALRLPRISVLEDLTRLVPDGAWITELRLSQGEADITGFAKEAAPLVPLLERSGLIAGATSIAPVTFDETAGRQRFSYRLRLRGEAAAHDNGTAAPAEPSLEGLP